eukprot:2810920-Pyramimonas_sp.AAC.1
MKVATAAASQPPQKPPFSRWTSQEPTNLATAATSQPPRKPRGLGWTSVSLLRWSYHGPTKAAAVAHFAATPGAARTWLNPRGPAFR